MRHIRASVGVTLCGVPVGMERREGFGEDMMGALWDGDRGIPVGT